MSSSITTLNGLLRAIHNSVVKAQEITETQHMRQISNYFDSDGNPITREIQVPDLHPSADEGAMRTLDVPLIALVPPSAIKIKELTMNFSVEIAGFPHESNVEEGYQAVKKHQEKHQGDLLIDLQTGHQEKSFFGKKGPVASVEIKFEASEPAESFMRINDQLIKTVC